MKKKLVIGIIGYGNIGAALGEVLKKQKKQILQNNGLEIVVKGICDTRKIKSPYPLYPNPYPLKRRRNSGQFMRFKKNFEEEP